MSWIESEKLFEYYVQLETTVVKITDDRMVGFLRKWKVPDGVKHRR